ncbi:MAG: hypothetical protein HQM10_19715 [Candidatus Riflebacteria bacterium]|nr:hypothetical protein [Candidatus Riflebacteria bacterium]
MRYSNCLMSCVFAGLTAFLCLLFPAVSSGATWISYAPPVKDNSTALAVLTDTNYTWVGYAGFGLVCYYSDGSVKYTLTKKNGLPSENVSSIIKRENEIWVGTADGLVCRGEEGGIRVFTVDNGLPDNGITCLLLSGSTVYAGTMKGLVKFEGDSSTFYDESHGLPSSHILSMATCEEGIVIGTTKGWAVMKGAAFEAHTPAIDQLPFEWISAVSWYKSGTSAMASGTSTSDEWFILGTAGHGLMIYRGGNYKVIDKEAEGPGSDWISSLEYEPETREMWIGTKDGICCWDMANGIWKRYTTQNSGLISNNVACLSVVAVDTSVTDYEILGSPCAKCVGCATCSKGLVETASGEKVKIKVCPDCWKIPSPRKSRILYRTQTWVAVATEIGAQMLMEKKLSHVGQGSYYGYLVNMDFEIKGVGVGSDKVWAGLIERMGIFKFKAQGFLYHFFPFNLKFLHVSSEPGPNDFVPSALKTLSMTPDGKPIAGGYNAGTGGAVVYNPDSETWTHYDRSQGLLDPEVRCIYRKGGSMVVGTGGGNCTGAVFSFNEGRFEEVSRKGLSVTDKQTMFKRPVTGVCTDGEKIFVGTDGDGAYVFDGDSWRRYNTLNNIGMTCDEITAVARYGSVLYLGNRKGIDCIGDDGTIFHVPCPNVTSLLWDDSEGNSDMLVLWIGRKDGLMRICKTSGLMNQPKALAPPHYGPTGSSFFWPMPCRDDGESGIIWEYFWCSSGESIDLCPFDGPPGEVTSLAYDDFNLWIGTTNGVGRMRK